MTALRDDDARERIRTGLDETLFVNAGAGSGKTSELVRRVVSLVLTDGVPLSRIAAVTFTEKAGAELRDRLRAVFEQHWLAKDAHAAAAQQALDDLDSAAIGTLHSFAQRILSEHPIEAGLPPIIEVLDEVGSSVAFDERWSELQSALLDDDAIAQPLLIGLSVDMTLKHVRSLAQLLGKDWDLIDERILVGQPPAVQVPDLDDFTARARAFAQRAEHCTADDDRLLPRLQEFGGLTEMLQAAPDTESKLGVLKQITCLKFGKIGQKGNWLVPVADIRADGTALTAEARMIIGTVQDQCLRQITAWVARRVLDAAETRRREGKLEFHDLLVLARDLLRRDAQVRAALHDSYQRLLLDEFQDTDPIQIELAARICGGAAASAERWQDIVLPPGRLFVVGDAKQSIYRFRRASIATYLEAERTIGEPAGLSTNFRTVEPIVDWINAVFGNLITYTDGGQPDYAPLTPHRGETGRGPSVTVLGATAHDDRPDAATLREREASDVAAVVRQALDERWQVLDTRTGAWRDARPDDIAVLVPARTSLPFLEDALDTAQIPYRAEASSLVYHAEEVRSLLACARAVADTSDSLALVTALRSPLFGCGDDDLWRWKHAGGSFSVFATADDEPLGAGPVGSALGYLRQLYFDSRWLAPSELLARIVADRRMLEVAAGQPRARDAWRRLRFVVDQARAWSEVARGGLRAYLAWAAHQGQEMSRVSEAVLPEKDADSVRVLTIHAAKGLEFPIVIMSGMTAQNRGLNGVVVLWPPAGGYEVKLRKSVQTGDYEAAVPIDEQMDELEKRRLLYVAATRARDHLVVSLHRNGLSSAETAATLLVGGGAATAPHVTAFTGYEYRRAPQAAGAVAPAPDYNQWLAGVQAARASSRRIPAITASGLEGTEPEVVFAARPPGEPADVKAGRAKGARDLELPPWSKGRYGSAIGRAVHAVLQIVDLASGDGVDEAIAAQVLAEGVGDHAELVRQLVAAALASDVVRRAAAREHWRETYVGTTRADGTVLEGYIDLIYREDDGSLAVVDYKTDAVPGGAIPSRVAYYKPQMDAYQEALGAATGARVTTTLLFLAPTAATAASC